MSCVRVVLCVINLVFAFFSPSIEENFVTWKEAMWPAVCQYFGVNSSQSTANIREYKLTIHTDLPSEKVFVGESNRLGAFAKQKS